MMKNRYSTAIQAAVEAGKTILEVYESNDFQVESKENDTPLTRADRRAHEIIASALDGTGYPLLSEEGREIPYMNRSWWSRFWLVDPLDGTKEFISRNGEFTVNIALVDEGTPGFGVVYAPVLNHLYVALPGRGAFLCKEEKNFDQPVDYLIQFSNRLPLAGPDEHLYRVVASRSHFNEETRAFIDSLDTGGKELALVNAGSSLKICRVASGEADLYPRLGPTMEWDTAAAHAVARAAGKRVCRLDDGEELEYNKENLLNPYFVVK